MLLLWGRTRVTGSRVVRNVTTRYVPDLDTSFPFPGVESVENGATRRGSRPSHPTGPLSLPSRRPVAVPGVSEVCPYRSMRGHPLPLRRLTSPETSNNSPDPVTWSTKAGTSSRRTGRTRGPCFRLPSLTRSDPWSGCIYRKRYVLRSLRSSQGTLYHWTFHRDFSSAETNRFR